MLGRCSGAVATGARAGALGVAAVAGGVGAPAGALLSLPQWKICVDIALGCGAPGAVGAEPTIVITSPLSTACT